MKIKSMLHTLRAVTTASNYHQFLVIGSQAILLHCYDRGYDYAFDESQEIDIVPVPQNSQLTDFIDGTFGEYSMFHQMHGYYAHGVGMETGIFPKGWENRLSRRIFELNEGEQTVIYYPSPEDTLISKAIAGREKDIRFIRDLVREDLVDRNTAAELLEQLPESLSGEHRKLVTQRIHGAFHDRSEDREEECDDGPSPS